MRNRVSICTLIIGLICPFTQVARGQQSGPVQPPPTMMVEGPQRSAGGSSESDVATANNPIAPLNAIYFQNYYAPTVYGVPGSTNLLDLRTLVVSGRQIVRATLPISSAEDNNGNEQSGLGDFSCFRRHPIVSRGIEECSCCWANANRSYCDEQFLRARQMASWVGCGWPSLAVGGSLLVGIFTWQHSFAGEHTRPGAQGVTFQPIAALSIGGGYYVRSSGIWNFDISNNKRLIPLGIGFGKVFKNGNAHCECVYRAAIHCLSRWNWAAIVPAFLWPAVPVQKEDRMTSEVRRRKKSSQSCGRSHRASRARNPLRNRFRYRRSPCARVLAQTRDTQTIHGAPVPLHSLLLFTGHYGATGAL